MTRRGSDLSLSRTSEGLAFWIHVSPRSRRGGVGPGHGDALRVAVAEPAREGAANAACARALAKALGVAREAVRLDPGSRGRRKRVRVRGDAQALEARVRELATGGVGD